MNETLLDRMRPVTRRLRSIRFWWSLAMITAVAAVAGWLMRQQVVSGQTPGMTAAIVLLSVVVAVALIAALVARQSYRNPRTVAKKIEAKFPNLDQRLLTALSQQDQQLGYLQQRVVREAGDHSRSHRWVDAVPSGRVVASKLSGLGATAFLVAVLMLLATSDPAIESTTASRIQPATKVEVLPGSVELERGSSLVVTARFAGWVPDEADLVCVNDDGSERRITMTQNLDDPLVGGFVSSVDRAFDYRVITPQWESDPYRVEVFDFPALVRSDANLEFPEYTAMESKRVEDTVRISAVEGTEVSWICYLNKEVASAELVDKEGNRTPLTMNSRFEGGMSTSMTLSETKRFTLELVDQAGRKNKYPPQLIARVLPNQPPSLKLTEAGDVAVSPLEELPIAAEVRDDFGVDKVGLSMSFGTRPPQDIVLGQQIPRGAKTKVEHMIEFEELQAEPDQLLTYYFWAEDFGPDGQRRRTESDMYFAEVRPFDEIFREGDSPPGGQQQQQQNGQNGQQAEELAELQKEIINATWRVLRSEPATKRSEKFGENVTLLLESQDQALRQLEELASKVEDEKSASYIDEVRNQMLEALKQLGIAADQMEVEPLRPAMAAEQAAYAGLLRLRAREFQVMRSQQRQQGQSRGQSGQRRQRQLDALELDQDENRYETQQQAQEQNEQEQQEREVRQVLNRLRELARRQEDLNKELAQLQSALEAAETEKEKEEIERQLKRLRDQQQDLLRETDELSERMQQPENQERMAESSEQLEETRENLRKASEALAEKNAAEALTAGRRAEREFEEMRDEFRQQAAGQFNDAVRQLRSDAQELDKQQEELSQKMRELDQPDDTAGLRAENNRDDLQDQLSGQREELNRLLEKMQETVEQSETAEPLLAQKLYDSYRQTRQRQVDQKLRDAAELLRRGFDPQAQQLEQGAAVGIDQLREDLEEAATSVLGDETKALERALSELEQLERELDSELQQNNPASQQGQQSGQQQGQQQGQQPGQQQGGQQSQQEGQQQGQQPGQQQGGQQGQQQGQQQGGQQSQQPGQQSGMRPSDDAEQRGLRGGRNDDRGGGSQWAAANPGAAPLTGDNFGEWSDRLRDVEEMVGDPEFRSEAARIRDRAREVRREFRRHSKEPQWDLVEELIAQPLRELKRNVSEELIRRSAEKHAPVPIDRDPVPAEYTDAVRKYYESLGSGR